MISKKQAEDGSQQTEIEPGGEGSAPAGDIADAWRDEFSEKLTWADLAKWLDCVPWRGVKASAQPRSPAGSGQEVRVSSQTT
jgi:hypothetical protein